MEEQTTVKGRLIQHKGPFINKRFALKLHSKNEISTLCLKKFSALNSR